VDRAQHVPVLAGRVTALLAPALVAEGAVLVDATLGRAGHARALLEACPGMFLIGIDADVAAIEAAGELLAPYAERVTLVHARYDEIPAILGRTQAMGLLFDLGVSSPQLDDPERGFAYAQDAPLDMRMDRTAERTAADVVNGYPPADPAYLQLAETGFRDYRLEVTGMVEQPRSFSLEELRALAYTRQITKHNCIQGWTNIAECASSSTSPAANAPTSGASPIAAAAQDKQNTDQQKQVDRGAIDQQLAQKRVELDQVTKQINDLEGKSTANQNTPQPTDPNQQKQQEEAKKANNRNLQLLKDKKQRLETEIRDLQDRRNSLN